MAVANAPTFYDTVTIASVRCFKVHVPEKNLIVDFFFLQKNSTTTILEPSPK
jgi:hypothetical protein